MTTEENTKPVKKNTTKFILAVAIVLIAIGGYFGLNLYKVYFAPNVSGNATYLYVKTGATIDDVYKEIKSKDLLKDVGTFSEAAAKMDLAQRLKPGTI